MNSKIPIKKPLKIQPIKNNFSMYQIKKMIGKKLLLPWVGLNINIQIKNSSKVIKSKILENMSTNSVKNLILTTVENQGILYVIKNLETYLAINSVSYKEMESMQLSENINIIIIQYPKLSKSDIKLLIGSSSDVK